MKLKAKLVGLIASLIVIFSISITYILYVINRVEKIATTIKDEQYALAQNAKDLQFHVIQVQQFLTDISATRGLDGLDSGFEEALEHYKAFFENATNMKSIFSATNDIKELKELNIIEEKFKSFYDTGKKMAELFVKEGPHAGNTLMGDFDKTAMNLTEKLSPFIINQSERLKSNINILEDSILLMEKTLIVGFIILIVILSIVVPRTVNSLIRPLLQMINVANEVSLGKIKGKCINITSKDEIGTLAKVIERMIHRFAELVANVEKIGQGHLTDKESQKPLAMEIECEEDEVSSAFNSMVLKLHVIISEIQLNMEQLHDIAALLRHSSGALSQVTQGLASSLEQTSSAAEQMHAVIKNIGDNITNSNKISLENEQTAQLGMQTVKEMVATVQEISATNSASLEKLEENNNNFAEITQIITDIGNKTKVINDIVFQTKILSFNASVEAARAGEHGKGFAVVAEEIGNLARMSGTAAKEITQMLHTGNKKVEEMLSLTKTNMLEMIQASNINIENGIHIAGKCENNLQQIVASAQNLQQDIKGISHASKETVIGINEITLAMRQMEQDIQTNTKVAEDTSNSSISLAERADNLQKMISHFKI